ncbi:MAG: 3-keto-disaccharide hydrolase [Algoriphagus sp.]
MKTFFTLLLLFVFQLSSLAQDSQWIELFSGKDLSGWRISENPSSFSVEDGLLKVAGPRAHAFYAGKVGGADFKNFELMVEVKTLPKANSGIFIHTAYQERDWPEKGYEVQVNQTHSDWRKSGSLYAVQDVSEVHVKDGEWYTYHVIVKGDQISVALNGKVVMEYDESADTKRTSTLGKKRFDRGTIALQAHDPESVIYFRSVKIKLLD